MLNPHDDRTISAKTATIIDHLKQNLAEHADIVKEAREGYVKSAEEALAKRLHQVREGKIVDLTFRLTPPQDHSNEYKTVLKMLELHLEAGEETIQLKASDVQQFVLNNWSWMDNFLVSNSGYSGKSQLIAKAKGLV
jgi:hypothetical protein